MAEAFDVGLGHDEKTRSSAQLLLRRALLEMAVARFAEGISSAQQAMTLTVDARERELGQTLVSLAASWAQQILPLSVPSPGNDEEPATLLRLSLIVQQWAIQDAPVTGLRWSDLEELLDRVTAGADTWLRGARTAAAFASGLPAAMFATFYVVHHSRSAWAAAFSERLRRGVGRYGLHAWAGWVETLLGLAHAMRGDYGTSREVIRRRLTMLDPGSAPTPNSVLAYAMLYSHSALTGTALAFESTDVEERLVGGAWSHVGDAVRHASAGFVALGLATRGEYAAAARMIDHFGPVQSQLLEHTMRVTVTEVRMWAAVAEADETLAVELLRYAESLYRSPMGIAATARMRALLGEPVDPVPPSRDTGVALDLVRAHWIRLIVARRDGDRALSLRELAHFDAVAARNGTHGLRVMAVALFRPEAETTRLTPRQHEVALLAAAGYTNEEIASRLFLGTKTVEGHVRAAIRVLALSGRSQLADALLPPQPVAGQRVLLTTRQGQVAALIAAGCSNAEIGRTLGLSVKTVEQHVGALRAVFDVRNRTAVAAAFLGGRH